MAIQQINLTNFVGVGVTIQASIDNVANTVLSCTVSNTTSETFEIDILDCSNNAVVQSLTWAPGESGTKSFSPAVPYSFKTITDRSGNQRLVLATPCYSMFFIGPLAQCN